MSRKAERALRELLMNNYGHYSRDHEKEILNRLLLGKEGELETDQIANGTYGLDSLEAFDYPLAKEPLRSVKNGLICLVAVVCREAADLGADNIKAYALSDYFINRIESELSMSNWSEILVEIVRSYRKLIKESRERPYSMPVRKAIIYINDHLYEKVSLGEVAESVGLSAPYLSLLFKKETGENISMLIKRMKMEEARKLLSAKEKTVSEISDLLGFTSASYFSKVFQNYCGYPPSSEKAEMF